MGRILRDWAVLGVFTSLMVASCKRDQPAPSVEGAKHSDFVARPSIILSDQRNVPRFELTNSSKEILKKSTFVFHDSEFRIEVILESNKISAKDYINIRATLGAHPVRGESGKATVEVYCNGLLEYETFKSNFAEFLKSLNTNQR